MSEMMGLTKDLHAQMDGVADDLRALMEEHLPRVSHEAQLELLEAASQLLDALLRDPAAAQEPPPSP